MNRESRNAFELFGKLFKPKSELGKELKKDIAKIGKELGDEEIMDEANEIVKREDKNG